MATSILTLNEHGGFREHPDSVLKHLPRKFAPPGPPGPLADFEIEEAMARPDDDPLRLRIVPFVGEQRKTLDDGRPAISYGLTSYGYDLRLGSTVRTLLDNGEPVDPFGPKIYGDPFTYDVGDPITIPPHGCLLGESVETIRMPADCVGVLVTKSTWARCFLTLNCTPLEPTWEGTVTLELANLSPRPLTVYAGHGIGQLRLDRGRRPRVAYCDRPGGGTYQRQSGPTPPKLGAGATG